METGCGGYTYTSVVTHSFSLSFALSGLKLCFSFVLLVVFCWLALYCRAKHDNFRLPDHTRLCRQLYARNPSEVPLSVRGGAEVYISAVSMVVLHYCPHRQAVDQHRVSSLYGLFLISSVSSSRVQSTEPREE